MIFKFKLVSDEVTNFSREIEIDSCASFLELRNAILDSVDYTKDDIDSFFLCDDEWQRQEEITLEDMGSASDQDIWLMEDTPLNELIEDEGQKLVFVFDYMTERSFFMEMKEIIPGKNLSEAICTLKRGKAPSQKIDLDEFEAKFEQAVNNPNAEELDIDEIYGGSQYDAEDIASGYDIDGMNNID